MKISEIASYLRAADERIAILFGSQPTIAERIKAHVIGLRREIGKLAEMADENDDEQLRRQINKFGEEAWFNMLVMLLEAASKFAPREPEAAPWEGGERNRPTTWPPLPLTLQSIKAKNPVKKRTSDGPSQFLT